MKKNKKYTIYITCDKEITTEVIQLFKFTDCDFEKITTECPLGIQKTAIIVKINKDKD